MPELKGQQLRVRVAKPIRGGVFRTKDPGRKGHMQIVMQRAPRGKGMKLQSIRYNLRDYRTRRSARAAVSANKHISKGEKAKSYRIIDRYYARKERPTSRMRTKRTDSRPKSRI